MTARATRVLLVEDNPEDVRIFEQLLAQDAADFEVTCVARLQEALPHLDAAHTDVVVLDLGLPDSDPNQTFDTLRQQAEGLPVIVLTGRADDGAAMRSMRCGAQDFLVKRAIDTPLLIRSLRYSIERQRFQDALRESEERYALAVEGANDGLWDWNLQTGEVYYAARWRAITGLDPVAAIGTPDDWFALVHRSDIDRLRRDIKHHLASETAQFSNEHRMRQSDGSYHWVLSRGVARRDARGAVRMAGSLTDIHDRKASEDRLRTAALSDALTGLPNWVLFTNRLRAAFAHAKRREHRFAVLFLDVDRFKTINDSLGHSNGDTLLVAISKRVSDMLRPGDTLARLGGDEFTALVEPCAEPRHARRVAERIHEQFKEPFRLDGHEVYISTSIGIAMSASHYEDPEECLRDADTAMYRAKSSGRGGHAIFDREMHERAVEQLKLENDLRRAVARREFRVHYQPIVDLDSGRIEGFEALARWNHPERGMIYPDSFIPMAEESGLIAQIGWLVFEEACRQLAAWRAQSNKPLFVSVNFSSRQLMEPDLVPRVEEVLARTGCRAEDIRLELTETMIMENADAGAQKLASLADLQLKVYIDDFGTGYSSLSYLHRLPTHAIKIDRSFVPEMACNPEIIGTIVTLARSLNMEVEAEGIETHTQLEHAGLLKQLGCHSGQGFYFSEALNSTAASRQLNRTYQ